MTMDVATLGELVACCGGAVRTGPFGSQLHKHDYVVDDDATPVVMPKDMIDGRVDTTSIARVDRETVKRLKQHVLASGDIVLARRGDIGRRAWIGDTEAGWLCGTGSMRISLRGCPRVRARYLYHYLATDAAIGWLEGHSVGATMSNLSAGVVEQLPVEFPPLDEQDRVIAMLDAITNLIDNNRRRVGLLERSAQMTYRDWFVQFRFPGHGSIELVDSELGSIPKGWECVRLADLVSTQYGYTESARTAPVGPKYLRGMDMNKATFIDWSTVPYCPISDDERERFRVSVGDVFVIRMADPGKVSICETEVDAVFASYLVRLVATDDRITPHYLFFTLNDDPYQGWVTGASTGATRKSVSATVMTEPVVLLPPRRVQDAFVAAIGPMRALLTTLLQQNATLRRLRELILPRLLSGELHVSARDLTLESVG